jgi:hypothetical protein
MFHVKRIKERAELAKILVEMQKIEHRQEDIQFEQHQLSMERRQPAGTWKITGGKGGFRWYFEEDPPK